MTRTAVSLRDKRGFLPPPHRAERYVVGTIPGACAPPYAFCKTMSPGARQPRQAMPKLL